jgi:hypothetical protein
MGTSKTLAERGLLKPGSNGKFARSIPVPGYKRMRLYHLTAAIIGEPDSVGDADAAATSGVDDAAPAVLV